MYKLSIIIPTKNRQFYCKEAIEQILSLNLKSTQLVIQDNSDTNELFDYIVKLNNEKIKYNYHPGILSFVDNFSEAVSLADGEYICMIGDDDGVLPFIEDIVDKFTKQGNCDAIIPGLNSVYCWPSSQPIFKKAEDGFLCVSFVNKKFKKVNPKDGLKLLLRRGGMDYQECLIPRLYHGIVRRQILEDIKEVTGKYFGGLTPDIYMAVSLALVCRDVFSIGFPVTVSGICPRSGSSDSATGRHTGKLEDAPHFRGHTNYKWDKTVPEIYSVETIWGETVLQALNDFKEKDRHKQFSIKYLDSLCYLKYPQFRDDIIAHAKAHKIGKFKMKMIAFRLKICPLILKYVKRVFRHKGSVVKYYGVADITEAGKLTADITKKKINI
ncbi:MAG: glycosyltransferase family 2 protein [Clostridia bacterium]|nr:glycosyltransferase family 2 protein [Clostridia bacterium]